jgi:hypothetical protein
MHILIEMYKKVLWEEPAKREREQGMSEEEPCAGHLAKHFICSTCPNSQSSVK